VNPLALASVLLAATPTPAQVVQAWSKALNTNDNGAAGALFAPNARIVQGPLDVRLTSRALAVAFNASLPCAGKVIRMHVVRNQVTATFKLGERPRHRCDAPGQEAAALFVVRAGKITLWKQVPVPSSVSA
jgi:limonene-1,2-epoxide hydrolase